MATIKFFYLAKALGLTLEQLGEMRAVDYLAAVRRVAS